MATKKYLSLEKLTEYDGLIKSEIAKGDESALSSAKSYVDEAIAIKANEEDVQTQFDTLSSQVAFISDSNEDDIEITVSNLAGTIHRFSVEVNCAPMYIPEDNLGPEFADGVEMYTDYGVLIFPKSYYY